MTVKELITTLQQYDGDAEISVGIDEIDDKHILVVYDNPENADEQSKIKI